MKNDSIKIKLFHLSENNFDKFDSLHPGNGALGTAAYFSSKDDNSVINILETQGKKISYSSEWEAEISNPFLIGKKIKNPQLSKFSKQNTKLTSEQIEKIKSILSEDHINESIYSKTNFDNIVESIEKLKDSEGADLLDRIINLSNHFTENNSSTILQKIGYDSIIAKDTNIAILDLNKLNKISSKKITDTDVILNSNELFDLGEDIPLPKKFDYNNILGKIKKSYKKSKYSNQVDINDVNFIGGVYFDNELTGKAYKRTLNKEFEDSFMAFSNNKDSMFIVMHGDKNGKVAFNGKAYSLEDIYDILSIDKLIPENVNDIYTISCYGGLQKPFISSDGVKISSSHTSKLPIKSNIDKYGNKIFAHFASADNAEMIPEAANLLANNTFSLQITHEQFKNALEHHNDFLKKEKINVKKYGNNQLYKDWEQLSSYERYHTYGGDYLNYHEKRKEKYEQRKAKENTKVNQRKAKPDKYKSNDTSNKNQNNNKQKDIDQQWLDDFDKKWKEQFGNDYNDYESIKKELYEQAHPGQKLDIDDISKPKNINQQYKELMDNYWINNFSETQRDNINKSIEALNKQNTNGAVFDKPNLFMKDKENKIHEVYKAMVQDKNGAAFAFTKGDTMFLTAHGTKNGNILFQGKEYSVEDFVGKLESEKLLPEDIKKIYTLNCYGGKQQSFITSKGVKVSSGHTSDKPIALNTSKNRDSIFVAVDKDADISDALKEDIIRLKDEEIKGIINPKEIKEALTEKTVKKPKKYKLKKGPKIKQEKPQMNDPFSRVSIDSNGNITGINPEDSKNLTPEQQKQWEQIQKNAEAKKNKPSNFEDIKNNNKELPKKELSNASQEAIEEGIEKSAKDINWSKIGKVGAIATVIGIGAYAIGKHNGNKKEQKQNNVQPEPNYQIHVANTAQASYNNNLLYNSYAQQMAADISSYRYGKQMTGFI